MNLTIRDIVKLVKWKEVKRALKFHYPFVKSDYESLFVHLLKMPKTKVKPNEYLNVFGGFDIKTEWFEKHGKEYLEDLAKGEEKTYYDIDMKIIPAPNQKDRHDCYGISFIPWKRLANTKINPDTLYHYTLEDIIAHFIWEITFYGNEKQMNKKGKELLKRVKEIKSGKAKLVEYTGNKKHET